MTDVTGVTEAAVGRRARKKAATRQAIAEAALGLFLERGYDRVTVKDVAEAADVSMSGLFKHFPTKESLVFDIEDDLQASLTGAVRDRPEGTPVLAALRSWLLQRIEAASGDPRHAEFQRLVSDTPALADHARRMWLRNEEELGRAITEAGPDAPGADVAGRALARFLLDRARPGHDVDPRRTLDAAVTLLADGWPAPELRRPPRTAPPEAAASPARPPGLRERKKAETRAAVNRAALDLFGEHGYDGVGVREVADAAGVSLATLFAHFPDGKASLVFPGGRADHVAALVRAVRERPVGHGVLRALHDHMATRGPFERNPDPDVRRTLDLVRATPDLADHALRTWTAAEDDLAVAVAEEAGLPDGDLTARLLARYVLQIPDLARTEPDARHTLDVVFGLLARGWPACLAPGTAAAATGPAWRPDAGRPAL
ncbi:TetR/AcrR family transcriptional regulator [Streptomyces antibioticus]|uniref:TetR family transcriptional regulator n=1 Tax=Streptomyces antibioticus TaxID=1890 RepID=A0AAE7CNX5_STRAT|nr:TetR/AcrR family transcriptional regulator [Streptomyces antibioticus]QIT48231.1 TetR family transcriptional regulator [Streptomyces antibioticus]